MTAEMTFPRENGHKRRKQLWASQSNVFPHSLSAEQSLVMVAAKVGFEPIPEVNRN